MFAHVPAGKPLYEFGNFRFDPANHLLLNGGSPVSLTPKVLEVLLVLVQNGSRLTTKEDLMRRVWPDSCVEEANLTVNISALRRILGETADGRPYIETVPKKGYRFVAPVAEVRETTDAPLQPHPQPTLVGRTPWRRFGVPVLGLLLLLLFVAVGYWPHDTIPIRHTQPRQP